MFWAPEAHAALALFFVRECDQKAHDYVAYAAEGETKERGRNNFGERGQHLGDLGWWPANLQFLLGSKKEALFSSVLFVLRIFSFV